ncbi:E3 ubiquitin-protein ligase RSL1-like, partial [Lotus japonicus]|uniref:E3 ubiquitin-protein ligase RSL1-like n=1 Tax=Lotus japonicus TaxID=34305 RepID=UPI002586C35B
MAHREEDSPSDLHADEFYFSALFDDETTPLIPVSDDRYAEELQFQEALMNALTTTSQTAPSSSSSSFPPPPPPPLPSPSLCVASSSKSVIEVTIATKTEPVEFATEEEEEEEEEEEAPPIICEICAEAREIDQMFRNQRCHHSFCSECITNQVAAKIQENITVVPCLGLNCRGVLELETCRSMLPKDLIERWDDAMCEAFLLAAEKFYCPYRDCAAMMLDENGREEIRESECPFCHRLFCAMCRVPWHPGVGCEEYQSLNEDERGREDLLVRELANQKKWRRCPRCRFYVEKREG